MSGATLFFLQNEVDSRVRNRLTDAIRFVTNNGEYILRRNHFCRRRDDVRQLRFSSDLVQHLGMFGFQARPFARRHNHDADTPGAMRVVGLSLCHSIQYTRDDIVSVSESRECLVTKKRRSRVRLMYADQLLMVFEEARCWECCLPPDSLSRRQSG